MSAALYCGLDVAQDTLELAREPAGVSGQFPHAPAGLAARVTQCQAR